MSESNPPQRPERILSDEIFEQFLLSVGLTFRLRRGPKGEPFGNWIIQYGDDNLDISMVSDRGDQCVTITDKSTIRSQGVLPLAPVIYDVSLIGEFLGSTSQTPMGFFDQKVFVHANWNAIVEMFSRENREATHQRLELLGRERVKRTFNPWPQVILDFEGFLQDKGFKCELREAPDGVLGNRLMKYNGDSLSVQIASEGGWQLLIADRISRPEMWYDIRTIEKMLLGDVDPPPFRQWFAIARENWEAIVATFRPEHREETHRRLQPLEEESRRRRQLFQEKQKAQIEQIKNRLARCSIKPQ